MDCPLGNNTCTHYVVKRAGGQGWVSRVDGRDFGPYLSRDLALQLAVADLHQRRKSGCPVRLSVENGQGAVAADRCLCMEAAPPASAAGA
jgi:hypothetical protein